MRRLILLRHGQSLYNAKNIFTGWSDVDLSHQGKDEAKNAGKILRQHKIYPDICYTSWLKRAIHTAQLALKEMEWEHIDCIKSWRLNERHYGAWQGRNKKEVEQEVGEEKFIAIRRGYATPPPPLEEGDERMVQNDLKYKDINASLLPLCESLKDTKIRTLAYYHDNILPQLELGKTVLVSAHGNSLRALVMEIESLDEAEIVQVEIPTGRPMLYEFDEKMQVVEKSFL